MTSLLINRKNFETSVKGKKVDLFTLSNNGGITVQLTNYGGTLVSILAPDKHGKYDDVLMGYDHIESFLNDPMYMGCMVGPVANRIADGKFKIDGNEYSLLKNNGKNHLHSAPDGFHTEVFDASQDGNKVSMSLSVPDMKTGFPGNALTTRSYTGVRISAGLFHLCHGSSPSPQL